MSISTLLQKFLAKIPSRDSSTQANPAPRVAAPAFVQVVPAEGPSAHGVPRYPPIDSGISVASVDVILSSHKDLIDKLRRNVGVKATDFDFLYLGPLRRAAAAVNLLPATRDKHHTGAGGLFRYILSMAVQAEQSANGLMFAASESVEIRRNVEEAWRHAAFLTGLTSELYRPLTELVVLDDAGNQWSPFMSSINDWAAKQGATRFFVRWNARDSARETITAANTLSSWAVTTVCSNEVLERLHKVKPAIVETIFGVASCTISPSDSSLAKLIADVRRRVIERDNALSTLAYGKLTLGTHLEPYFLDVMRTLISKGVWQINAKGARVHWGSDGMYVAWRTGATEMLAELASQKIEGVPNNRETLADMMGKAGIISVAPDGSWVHTVHPSVGGTSTILAIRIQTPNSVLGNVEAQPVAHSLRANKDASQTTKAPPAEKKPETTKPSQTPKPIQPWEEGEKPAINEATSVAPTASLNIDQSTGEIQFPPSEKSVVETKPESTATVAKPAQVEISPTIPKGGIPSVPDVEITLDSFDQEVRMLLGDSISREVISWREMWNRGQQTKFFLKNGDGFAVSQELLAKSAIQLNVLVERLADNGYLVIKVENGRNRKLRSFPFAGKDHLGICLTPTLVRKAGFVMD